MVIGSSFVIVTKDKIGEWWSFLNNEVHLTSNNSNLQRENEKVPVWVIVWKCGNLYCKKRKQWSKKGILAGNIQAPINFKKMYFCSTV